MPERPGRTLSHAGSPQAWLAVEAETNRTIPAGDADAVLARLLREILAGQQPVGITHQQRNTESAARLLGLGDQEQALLADRYALDRQQARGAWYIPDKVKIAAGLCRLPAALSSEGHYALVTVAEDAINVPTRAAADHVFLWSAVLPLVERILAPIVLRSGLPSTPPTGSQRSSWEAVEAYYDRLGVDGGPGYDAMCFGSGWGKLDRDERHHARIALISHLAPQMTDSVVARHRADVTADLVAAFYAKAGREIPLARRVLTKQYQPTLSAFFAGDWLAFLDYVGEQPNVNEEVHTALPEPRLYIPGSARVKGIAAERGLEAARVEAVLASFSGQPTATNPFDERRQVIHAWWKAYDAAHERQKPGKPALWGLLGDGGVGLQREGNLGWQPTPSLHLRTFPRQVLDDIDRLWRRTTLPRWPEQLVVQPHPHLAFSTAVGPALKFWDGVALTVWFSTEGPVSRTPIPQLADYHAAELDKLRATGTPVNRELFMELIDAEDQLGPMKEVRVKDARRIEVQAAPGQEGQPASFISVDDVRTRRSGFEALRDIVTRHRRAWAVEHLDAYLRQSWEASLRDLSRTYNQALAARGRPMTVKQFSAKAAPIANAWFGGRVELVYAAIGAKADLQQVDVGPDLHCRIEQLSQYVFHLMGGDLDADWRQDEWLVRTLGTRTDKYIQLSAARGTPATLKDLNLDGDPAHEAELLTLWPRYESAVQTAITTDPVVIAETLAPPQRRSAGSSAAENSATISAGQAPESSPTWSVDQTEQSRADEGSGKRESLFRRIFRSRNG